MVRGRGRGRGRGRKTPLTIVGSSVGTRVDAIEIGGQEQSKTFNSNEGFVMEKEVLSRVKVSRRLNINSPLDNEESCEN